MNPRRFVIVLFALMGFAIGYQSFVIRDLGRMHHEACDEAINAHREAAHCRLLYEAEKRVVADLKAKLGGN